MRDTLTFHARHASHRPAFLCGRCESALVSISALVCGFYGNKILPEAGVCQGRKMGKTVKKHFPAFCMPQTKNRPQSLSAGRFFFGCCRCGRKPSSVVGRSSIYAVRCRTAQAFSLRARRAAVLPLIGTCIGWGLQRVSVTGTRVSSYLAFPSLPGGEPRAVYFCCTFLGVASTGR